MLWGIPPGLLLIVGALLVPLLHGHWRRAYMTILPLAGLWALAGADHGTFYGFSFLSYEIAPVRIDGLSLVFGYVFHVAAALSVIYAWHNDDTVEQVAGLAYAGSGIGALFAGDLITLFVYWEAMALTSVFLIWARRSDGAFRAGMRYLVIQIGSGVLLLSGAILLAQQSGSVAFDRMTLGDTATWLILIAFGIKCGFPLLHNWLTDAYPEATVTGTVFLSAFTTKCAVYALARGFPGTELLIYVGAAMAVFPIVYGLLENDLRRTLAYSMISAIGLMVCSVGIGTELALNGAAAYAVAHILYKALLFMATGAVLYRVGTAKADELGGLYKSMPLTAFFCIVGAASLAAFPLFAGYAAKSPVLSAIAYKDLLLVWLLLLAGSAGMFLYSGIKVPFFAFFAKDSGKRCQEAPLNMLIAMGILAFLCIALGVYSPWLYALLPYPIDYQPYTVSHVINQYQLLLFSALAFAVLIRYRRFPQPRNTANIDFDITYRKWLPALYNWFKSATRDGWQSILLDLRTGVFRFVDYMSRHHGPGGVLARTWPTGSMALWVAVMLGGLLLIYYI
ncbi:MAG: Na(+)/H(+) antiporter subunit D [Rhodospirillaceae bacterium]